MKHYAYVRLKNEGIIPTKFKAHREIINNFAAKGYKYSGYIPVEIGGHGRILAIDLIFETDEDEYNENN